MAYQKLQVSRGLVVIPSNTVDIPFPGAEITSSTTTGTSALKLIDTAGDFVNKGIKIGDIVYADVAATVTAIDSATQLSVTTIVATLTAYKIYTPGKNDGCVLYVGTTGTVDVITAGGDAILFTAVPAGMFMPVQVTRVKATSGASTIVAMW
tara:strand:- start:3326 stop:3781 length:456 start_codon:yes stop_codon:yes gene_type:complete